MMHNKIVKAHQSVFGNNFRLFAAPGRINLIGEHTDYNMGFVLPAAIDKHIYLAIGYSTDESVTIHSVDFNETITFRPEEQINGMPGWAYYPYGVVKELEKSGHRIGGFCATFGGDIPLGAGLSSSAALEVVFVYALNSLFDFQISELAMARIAQMAEHNYAGVMCGLMDQFASVYGKAGHVIRLDCRSLEFSYFPIELGDFELILIDTCVKHSLASTAYNQRRNECEAGIRYLQTYLPGLQSLRDLEPKSLQTFRKGMDKTVFQRCEYITEENDRVIETCKVLEIGDLHRVGTLLFESHDGLQNKYQVSCSELDNLVETAKNFDGVLGARMMGGGFGGCTINLVKTSKITEFKNRAISNFSHTFNREPAFWEIQTSDGVHEV